jgi:hypothetical protein
MLDKLRKLIEAEMNYDDVNDIMMEATDDVIANMFIEDDGEAVMDDKEIARILNNIPEYNEKEAMEKKLNKIVEAYIPEELSYIEESSSEEEE